MVLLLPAAFALGCVPVGRVVLRLLDRSHDAPPDKAGAHAVMKRVGVGPAIAVGALDCLKGYAIGRWARRRGAGRNAVGLLAVAPLLANVFVVRGRGAATGVGSAMAISEADMAVVAVPIVGFTAARHHAFGVMIGVLCLPFSRWLWCRKAWAPFWAAVISGVLIYARLRGEGNRAEGPLTREVAWSRFWFDRDPPAPGAGSREGKTA